MAIEDSTSRMGRRATGHAVERAQLLRIGLVIVAAELLVLLLYAARPNVEITNPLPMLYPLIWIDVSLLVIVNVWNRQLPDLSSKRRWVAGLLAVGYFLVLGHFGGLYGWFGGGRGLQLALGLPPGASPALLYNGRPLVLVLQPYKVLGYLTLTYLVYRTILFAAGSAVSGVIGMFSCVSCSWPLIGLLLSTLFGSTSAVAAVALTHDYLLSTIIFVTSVGLLYWQPRFGSVPRNRIPGF